MTARPTILLFVQHYLPGHKAGGALRSVANTVEWMGDDFDFRIVASDRDLGDEAPYVGVRRGEWVPVGKAQVMYLAPQQRSLGRIRRLLRDEPHDILFLNSFFDISFTLKPLLARHLSPRPAPAILAPRGELSQGSLGLKAWKKRPFLALARLTGFYRGLVWNPSTEHDRAQIIKAVGTPTQNICVAADLPSPPGARATTAAAPREADAPLRICFLSRISPEKNLDYALDVLRRVTAPVRFDIYGPIRDDTDYWARCQALMAQLPAHIEATYRGSVPSHLTSQVYAQNDLFFLPTRGENFGHVILESLTEGTPVLISDNTPWRGLAAEGVGWDLPLSSPDDFARRIEEMAALGQHDLAHMRDRAAAFAKSQIDIDAIVAATRALFQKALDGRRPS